ncbi:MAG: D-glycero-beta-D-manno-heptose 1,7-bisphosphate 7-phosphatase [Acidithiobacillus ferriphilus]|uniref:D,D-heptose 1,7-bisphosphate phosphatase n=1 Tax=Acidithiobacillus ferrivorans TaxID=160808 RepID=A0A257TAE4_9PROT|nr:D-glycero-beta-D-manno-heptose 1,7-bisphosphate 7-phosphatase [Acidithiobacillus ferriphilus]OYV82349.1 MAG: D-glycero-beta-D-manno-heptose-1,7-bisphosphate 7-phosphatase [Acidithiobacillus ferrivorans]MBU2784965.1 D-glycero-beta-D-manno-heptose 1,7-bisphosphate 7-phosphatase [Acidithiobacillus ferriphilus]MBU2827292.1 D-glycero-beta-D-manno-heptose 1,7-bisphosphate 7-phosphatase [Acidithiobacillus ferriphilus]MBU2846654.1 D-glycero-beta-D-manno-heptose 1,7-bisphosphate 7-phosphatase [Acidit
MGQLVILDRDGVINEDSNAFIKSPAEWRPIPGSLEAIARLNRASYQVVVATNQSGVGRRLFDIRTLTAIHQRMRQELAAVGGRIDAIFFCPHPPEAECACRKPAPGLFREIQERLQISLEQVPAIGDSMRDMLAARAAGARPMLVLTGKGQSMRLAAEAAGVSIFADLNAAVHAILSIP